MTPLLRPRWWGLHLFTIAVAVFMVLMGRWQWHVAQARHDDMRNYAYALQWWVFTVFAFIMWWRILRDSAEPAESEQRARAGEPDDTAYVGYRPPTQAQQSHDDDDPERRAYNEYLDRLNRLDQLDRKEST